MLVLEESEVQGSESSAQVNQKASGGAKDRLWFSRFTTGGFQFGPDCRNSYILRIRAEWTPSSIILGSNTTHLQTQLVFVLPVVNKWSVLEASR